MNERIKEIREIFGLSLEAFGERIGISKTSVSRLEKMNETQVSRQSNPFVGNLILITLGLKRGWEK